MPLRVGQNDNYHKLLINWALDKMHYISLVCSHRFPVMPEIVFGNNKIAVHVLTKNYSWKLHVVQIYPCDIYLASCFWAFYFLPQKTCPPRGFVDGDVALVDREHQS